MTDVQLVTPAEAVGLATAQGLKTTVGHVLSAIKSGKLPVVEKQLHWRYRDGCEEWDYYLSSNAVVCWARDLQAKRLGHQAAAKAHPDNQARLEDKYWKKTKAGSLSYWLRNKEKQGKAGLF